MVLIIRTLLLTSFLSGHPLHVSITSMELDRAKGEISVSHKFFIDDFSLLFYHLYENNIQPAEGAEFSDAELQVIRQYMAQVFSVVADQDHTLDLVYTGKEQDEDSIWLYFKGKLPDGLNGNLSVKNIIMLDLYDDQTNLVIIADDGKEQGFTFDYKNTEGTVDLEPGN